MGIDMTVKGLGNPKPPKRLRDPRGITARDRERKARADELYARKIRMKVDDRDGYCRYGYDMYVTTHGADCSGPSEWAHFEEKKRARTRGQEPEVRHTTVDSLKLCRRHHEKYDAGILKIRALTKRGCDGELEYTR